MIKILDDEMNDVWINPMHVITIRKKYCTLINGMNIFFKTEEERVHLETGVTRYINNLWPPIAKNIGVQ